MTLLSDTAATDDIVRIQADHDLTKHLGNWTTARRFEIRARRGAVVLDLRSPDIAAGDIEIHADIDHGMVKLLLPADAQLDQWGLSWAGSGRVKDWQGAVGQGRTVRLTGQVRSGEIRVHRGGIAMLSAIASRAFIEDARRAHRDGTRTTVDDPTRTA